MVQNLPEGHDRLSPCHYLSRQVTFHLLTNQVHELCLYPTVNLSVTLLVFPLSYTNIDPSYEFAGASVNVYARFEGLVAAVGLKLRLITEKSELLHC